MHIRDLKLYKGRRSNILSALTFNDAFYWGADIFVAIIFALYLTQNIEGGTATHVGIIYAIYRISRALFALPFGRFFDKHKGYVDETWALILSGLIVGSSYIGLFFATELWQVYVAMIVVGIGHAMNIGSWTVLFYNNMRKDQRGKVVGAYQTIMQIVYGLSAALAGFAGDRFGFEWIILIAGIATILSGIAPFTIKSLLKK